MKGNGCCSIHLMLFIALARVSISLRQSGRWYYAGLTRRRYSKAHLGKEKRAAWSEPIDLQRHQIHRQNLGCTVNDILVTVVAGALGRIFRVRGVSAEDLNIRSFIPINLRPVKLDERLGNKFGLLFLSLPLGITDPVERLYQDQAEYGRAQVVCRSIATFGIINLIGAVPTWARRGWQSTFLTRRARPL